MPRRREFKPTMRSKLISPALNAKAAQEWERIESRFPKISKKESLRRFIKPIERLDQRHLAELVGKMPELVNTIQHAEKPHAKQIQKLAFEAVRRLFGKYMPEFFEDIETRPLRKAEAERTAKAQMGGKAKAPKVERERLDRIAEGLRMQSFLAHGVAFHMQENMLARFKKQIDRMNPSLFPMYELLNTYMRASYYYEVENMRSGFQSPAMYAGKGKTTINFVEKVSKKNPRHRFWSPVAFAKAEATCLPALMHEVGEAASHIASKEITSDAMKHLKDKEREYVFGKLHSREAEIHSYIYGPVIYSSLSKIFKHLALLPLSAMPLTREQITRRMISEAEPRLKGTDIKRIVGNWVLFLRMPVERQKYYAETSLGVNTRDKRIVLVEQLRKELHRYKQLGRR